MSCDTIRENLLAYLYGAIEAAEERGIEDHLAACAACREALERARGQREVLAEAASLSSDDLVFEAPPPRRRGRLFTRPRMAAAAALLLAVAGLLVYRTRLREPILTRHPRVAVQGPATLTPDAPAEFLVRTETIDGNPLSAEVWARVLRGGSTVLAERSVETDAHGVARLDFPAGIGRPGEALLLDVRASFSRAETRASAFLLRDARRLLSYVTTDKPLYRPGETVRVRTVSLERTRLTPAGTLLATLKLLDPKETVLLEGPLVAEDGVGAANLTLPGDLAGGEYTVLLTHPQGGFPDVSRTITVRSYRVPRLKTDLELDRDSYGPGASGRAFVSIERAEGGVPEGARIVSVLTVDGNEVSREEYALAASGVLGVPFRLPAVIAEGRGQLALTIHDGGSVESTVRTIPIALDRLEVALFPEGGDLVAGLSNRVYFSVRDPQGDPADLMADVVDSKGRVVAKAEVDMLGMGRFELTPARDETYRLVPRRPAGVELAGEKLAALDAGVVLRGLDEVVPAGGEIRLDVAATEGGEHTVAAWCRGVLVAQDAVRLEAGVAQRLTLTPTTDVGGVLRITVLDHAGVPRAERLVSRAPVRRIDIDVRPETESYSPGDTVRVGVTTRDENGDPTPAVLGVSVVDDSVLALANDEDTPPLPLHFLLGLEVEELEQVELFAEGPEGARAVDLLLGVQGWRRFAWHEPEAFLAAHSETGPRIVPVAKGGDSLVRVDNLEEARASAAWALEEADSKVYQIAALLLLGAGLGLLGAVVIRRPGSHAAVRVVAGYATAFAGAILLLTAAVAPDPPVSGASGLTPLIVQQVLPMNGQEVLPDLFDVEGIVSLRASNELDAARIWRVYVVDELLVRHANLGGAGGGGGGRGSYLVHATNTLTFESGLLGLNGRFGWLSSWGGYAYPPVIRAREYAHKKQPATDGVRNDFTEVLYWNPLLVTGKDGSGSFEFDTNDSMTTFSIGVEAHDDRGALATAETTISNRLPFFLEPKVPQALSAGDRLLLPVVVGNDTLAALDIQVELTADTALASITSPSLLTLNVDPGERGRILSELIAKQGGGTLNLLLVGRAGGLEDRSERAIPVSPRGYPMDVSLSGVLEKRDATSLLLPAEMDRSTLDGSLRLYPSMLATLTDGLESMLRTPSGCFEQASSTNYPNVLILSYLSERGEVAPAVARRAKSQLATGYRLLTGYECEKRGYEWFGSDPAHEALTAYGLMEFAEMARVYEVDEKMVDRTRDWLLSRRDGKGGFRADRSSHSFGRAPQELHDAYVVWALTEADAEAPVVGELDLLESRARQSDDPYLLALGALAAGNAGRPAAESLVKKLAGLQEEDGRLEGKSTSITSSRGRNLTVETTSLAALAFLRSGKHLARGEMAVRYLLEQRRQGGRFGATQATILALRALVEHGRKARRVTTAHDLSVFLNGRAVAERHVPEGAKGVIVFEKEVLDALVPGRNDIEIRTSGDETLPWSLSLRYRTEVPPSTPDCAVGVTTALDRQKVAEGGTVGLTVTLTNREDGEIPMTLARVGLPAGLAPRPDQLTERREAGDYAFFETRPREITLYLQGMKPGEERRIELDLVADVPGEFEGPATSAYLYYTDDEKTWAAPMRIEITPAK